MLLGLLVDNDPVCLSCAPGLTQGELCRAQYLYDDDVSNLNLSCGRCADMLVDYTGLYTEEYFRTLTGDCAEDDD